MKKKKFIYIKGNRRIIISTAKYRKIKKLINRFYYVQKLDNINHLLYISKYDREDFNAIEYIKDPNADVEAMCIQHDVEHSICVALSTLSEDERRLIFYIYYRGFSLERVAKLENTYKMDIMRKRNRILKKLKQKLKRYASYTKE